MWKARRWALFSPMPGSFASSFTSRAIGSATAMALGEARNLDAARGGRHVGVGRDARLLDGGVHRGGDEVSEQGGIGGVDDLRVDGEAGHLALAVHVHLLVLPARLGVHRELGELLARVRHRLL